MTGVYKITNTVNGKVYIGQSTNIKQRWSQHRQHLNGGYHCNDYLQRSWMKYGKDAFTFEVLQECTVDELDAYEEKYISMYDSTNFEKGYNEKTGGNQCRLTERTKAKLRKPKGPLSPEHIAKMSAARKGIPAWNKGLITPPEVRAKQSKARIGKKPCNCKQVLCATTGKVFHDTVEAAKYYGLVATNIRKCCRKERHTVGGMEWTYMS